MGVGVKHIRTINLVGGVFPNDPDWADPAQDLPTVGAWACNGQFGRCMIRLAALDAANKRVSGVTANIACLVLSPPQDFGLLPGEEWIRHDNDTRTGALLSNPLVVNAGNNVLLVRVSGVANIGTATQIRIAAQGIL